MERSCSYYEHYRVSWVSRGLEVHCSGITLSAHCSPEWSEADRQVWVCGQGLVPPEADWSLSPSGLNALWSLYVWKRKSKRGHRFQLQSDKKHQMALIYFFISKHWNQPYLLGLNCADMADRDGCGNIGFWGFMVKSEVFVSWPFQGMETFPSLRMMPGPSLPIVRDGAHTSSGGGPWWLLEWTWLPDDQEEVRSLVGGDSSSVTNRTDFAG